MPPQSQILNNMVLANNHFTNEWPVPGCSSCLPGDTPAPSGPGQRISKVTWRYTGSTMIRIFTIMPCSGARSPIGRCGWRHGHVPDDQGPGQEYIELYQFDATQTNRLTHIVNNVNYWTSRKPV